MLIRLVSYLFCLFFLFAISEVEYVMEIQSVNGGIYLNNILVKLFENNKKFKFFF